jgi:lipopolysaccharide/colanic/teichoic acid biosynthesis glycosyltransferase
VIITIAVIIKLTSKGPVIYIQKRVGLNGRLFNFYKFRSMYANDGEDEKRKAMMLDFMKNDNAGKIIDEGRVTAIGRFIRKTSLDELPQLYNVIRGDMSIVGPRPCLWYEFENYTEWQKRRVNVVPGCTGVWQVSGRSSVSFNDSIVLDLYYLMKMSPMYDIKLILKTIPVMLLSRGGK